MKDLIQVFTMTETERYQVDKLINAIVSTKDWNVCADVRGTLALNKHFMLITNKNVLVQVVHALHNLYQATTTGHIIFMKEHTNMNNLILMTLCSTQMKDTVTIGNIFQKEDIQTRYQYLIHYLMLTK